MMPGKSISPVWSLRTRLSRISCLTGRERRLDRRSSPRVWMAAMNGFYQFAAMVCRIGVLGVTLGRVRHRFFESTRPLVFAHRGGAALAPENTMAAFDNGLALGADGLELDVRLSRDGRVVVHHDRTLDRTTALTGPIGRRSADELNEAAVPLLSDVLARNREPR